MYDIKEIYTSREEAIMLLNECLKLNKSNTFNLDSVHNRTLGVFDKIFGARSAVHIGLQVKRMEAERTVNRTLRRTDNIYRQGAIQLLHNCTQFIKEKIDNDGHLVLKSENTNSVKSVVHFAEGNNHLVESNVKLQGEKEKLVLQNSELEKQLTELKDRYSKLELKNSEMESQISHYVETDKSHKEAMQHFENRLSQIKIVHSELSEEKESLQHKISDMQRRVEANERGDIPVGSVSFLRLARSLTTPAFWGVIGALAAIIIASGWVGGNFQKFSSEKEIYELRKECQERIDQLKKDNYRPDLLRPN